MTDLYRVGVLTWGFITACTLISGCGNTPDVDETGEEGSRLTDAEAPPVVEPVETPATEAPHTGSVPDFSPVVLGGHPPAARNEAQHDEPGSAVEQRHELLAAMRPLQVMLGEWRGITRRQVGDFKGVDEPRWVWDFQTDRNQPAMVMRSEDSPYFRELRLTWRTETDTFYMTSLGPQNESRTFEGTFSEAPAEVRGDDNRSHTTYKLALTQVESDEADDEWQVVFNQQENNRYLLEIYQKRGNTFRRIDTVSTQREGTSIAASDEDYGDRKCVISGGLGTIQVSYKGRTFWVCCTGCKAAFEEDPESWIAEYDAADR